MKISLLGAAQIFEVFINTIIVIARSEVTEQSHKPTNCHCEEHRDEAISLIAW